MMRMVFQYDIWQRIKLANFHSYSTLNFSKVTESEARKEILKLSTKKATKNGDIPAEILKKSVDIYIKEITFIINDCLEKGIFHDDLKLADVSPIFKKEDAYGFSRTSLKLMQNYLCNR